MVRSALFVLVLACVAFAGDREPVPLERLLADLASPDYQTRRRAILACEGREEKEVFERLLRVAEIDAHPHLRGQAAETLATFDDPRVFDTLVAMARRESPVVRRSVFVALGRHGDERARSLLLEGLHAERGTRGYAARGLGLLGDPSTFGDVLEAYLAHLDDPYLHDLGVEALFRLDPGRAVAALLPRFATLPGPARLRLARSLGEHATPEVTKTMVAHLASEDRGLREAAVLALGLGGDRDATEALVAHLSRRPDEAGPAIRALGALADPRATRALCAALAKAEDALTKVQAMQALASIGDRRAVAALVPCLEDHRDTRQPRQISAIWTFPYNSRVDAAAVWAIRTLVDGKEPFDTMTIARFPDPVLPPEVAEEAVRIRAWWKSLQDRSAWTIGE